MGFYFNSQIPAGRLKEFCGITRREEDYLHDLYQTGSLTARAYHKILRVARTIADLEGKEDIQTEHISEAVCYRKNDRKYWG